MQTYTHRIYENMITRHLKAFPCVALLGARQVGKSTLAKQIIRNNPDYIYIDLEDPRDFAKLQDPMMFLIANKEKLICIDEVQRYPEIFQVFRSYLDQNNRYGQLFLLGSASPDLIKQSSESLAGRISYIEINPFMASEINNLNKLWLHGGYPESYNLDEELSFEWRINYIRTFLERDIPNLGIKIPPTTLRRFWTMLCHMNGAVLNASKLASSVGVTVPTIKRYLDILEGTFIIRSLKPFFTNTKKRLIKSPKIYIRDTGLIHTLLGIETYNDLLSHPILGTSYESFIISSLCTKFSKFDYCFYRSSSGTEIDLVLIKGIKKIAIEIKSTSAPRLTQGFFEGLKIIKPNTAIVIAPVKESFPIHKDIWVHNITTVLEMNF